MFDNQPALGEPAKGTLTLIQDPFFLQNIQSINIHGMPWGGKQRWNAIVTFRSGLTGGEDETGPQRTFEEVIQKLRAILDEVQNK